MSTQTSLRVLLIDPDPAEAQRIQALLASYSQIHLEVVRHLDGAQARLASPAFDLALLSLDACGHRASSTATDAAAALAPDPQELDPDAPALYVAPIDAWLRQFARIPLVVMGVVAVLYDRPLPYPDLALFATRILAARAAAELERQQVDVALVDRRRRTQLILESVAEGILGLDASSRITFVNPAALALLGWTEAELRSGPTLTWSDEVRAIHEVSPDYSSSIENAINFYAPEYRVPSAPPLKRASKRAHPTIWNSKSFRPRGIAFGCAPLPKPCAMNRARLYTYKAHSRIFPHARPPKQA